MFDLASWENLRNVIPGRVLDEKYFIALVEEFAPADLVIYKKILSKYSFSDLFWQKTLKIIYWSAFLLNSLNSPFKFSVSTVFKVNFGVNFGAFLGLGFEDAPSKRGYHIISELVSSGFTLSYEELEVLKEVSGELDSMTLKDLLFMTDKPLLKLFLISLTLYLEGGNEVRKS